MIPRHWLLPAHASVLAAYGLAGYAMLLQSGVATANVVGYLTGIVMLLCVMAWHWWKGLYR